MSITEELYVKQQIHSNFYISRLTNENAINAINTAFLNAMLCTYNDNTDL